MTIVNELLRVKKELQFFIEDVSSRLFKICINKDLISGKESKNNSLDVFYIEKRLFNVVGGYKSFIPLLKPLALGNTLNNRIQFKFLQDFIHSIGIDQEIAILDGNPWGKIQGEKNKDFDFSLLKEIFEILISQVNLHGKSNTHKQEILNTFYSYLHYSLNFSHLNCNKIPFVVVANDHNPILIGFSLAAKNKGINRLYLQHASVTEYFPPLDFELSILGNFKSSQIYNSPPEFAANGNKVIIIPRQPFDAYGDVDFCDELPCNNNGKIKICFYLTGSSIQKNLFDAVDRISRNPFVDSFFIKPHPNESYNRDISKFLEKYSKFLINKPLEFPHIAIAGESSVCIQLRAAGIRVYQGHFLDDIPKDYYGFVKDGFCDEVTLDQLVGNFWEKWDVKKKLISRKIYITEKNDEIVEKSNRALKEFLIDRLAEFSKYNIKDIDNSLCYNSYLQKIKNIFNGINGNEFNKYTKQLININLSDLDDPIVRVKFFDFLHKSRSPNVYNLLKLASLSENSNELKIYFKYFHALWKNIYIPDREVFLDVLVASRQEVGLLKKYSITAILAYVFEFKNHVFIDKFITINFLKTNNVLNISNVNKLIISNLNLDINPDLIDFYNEKYTDFDKEVLFWLVLWNNPQKSLMVSYSGRYFSRVLDSSHYIEVKNFLPLLNKKISLELDGIYKSLDKHIISNGVKDYLMARTNSCFVDEFFEKIEFSIKNKKGFSFIRLSDGEGYVFDGFSFDEEDCLNRELHWWGTKLNSILRNKIKNELHLAVKNANALGIPSIFRLRRDIHLKTDSLEQTIQLRGMVSVLHGINNFFKEKLLNCQFILEEKSNQFLFSDVLKLKKMIDLAEKTIVISSVDADVFSTIFKSNDIHYVKIPTHARTNGERGYNTCEKSLPFVYEEIKNELLAAVKPGYLVLVSAGVIGKLFINLSGELGGVALDIGECADNYMKLLKNTV